MTVIEKRIGIDVLTAARRRIADALGGADSFAVMYSGGKDSQAALHLVRDWCEQNDRLPVSVVFRDEELLPAGVLEILEHYGGLDWVRLHWFVVPMKNSSAAMGNPRSIVTWGNDRPHFRPLPTNPWVIRPAEGDTTVYDQRTMDGYVYERCGMVGSAVFVTGIRADESPMRRQAIKQKRSRFHMSASSDPRVKLVRPIYDWSMGDVFHYLKNVAGVAYCEEYDKQAVSGMRLRISTPLHGEAIRELHKAQKSDPEFLEGLYELFPEVELHVAYGKQIARRTMASYAGCTIADCARFIQGMENGAKKQAAAKLFRKYVVHFTRAPEAYPPELLMFQLALGNTKRNMLQPLAVSWQKRLQRARAAKEAS